MADLSVLQIAHDHPEFSSGGTEWVAHDLTRALERRNGVAVRLLAATTSLSRPEDEPGAIGRIGRDLLLRTGAYDAFSMTRQDGLGWTHGLARLLRTIAPDIVHLHGLDRFGSEVVPFIRAHRPAARIVLTLHDFQLICAKDGLMVTSDGALCHRATADACRRCLPALPMARHSLRRAHLQAVLAGVDLFVAPSRFLRDRFVDWGLPPERIVFVPNAVPGASGGSRARLRGDRFAFFGNILPHKGAMVLLDAAARLRERGTAVEIRLHGGFTWSAEAERDAFAAALARAAPIAQHLGPYDRNDVGNLMRRADWIVVPSIWWENAPLVILEAQRAGLPVICSGIGGMAELVEDGVTGLHIPPGDAAALADTIGAATAPGLCRRLAANLRPPADPDAFAEAHLTCYRRLLEEVPA